MSVWFSPIQSEILRNRFTCVLSSLLRISVIALEFAPRKLVRSLTSRGRYLSCGRFGVSLKLVSQLCRVAVERRFEFAKRGRLYLICVLKFADPFGLFSLESRDLTLNLHALLVFFIDAANQLLALLETLTLFFKHALLEGLFLLGTYHILHILVFKGLVLLLDLTHLLVLDGFLL